MKKIYLIRHGRTDWNSLGKFQGITDTCLSKEGIGQAYALAERLKGLELDIIYCSPLKRALETARPLAHSKGIPIVERQELIEADFGHWEGLSLEEIKERYTDEFEKCRSDPFKYGFRFGLEYNDVLRTVQRFIDECIDKNDDYDKIAIISHSVPLKMLLTVLVGLPPDFLHSFRLDNCSITTIGPKPEEGDNKYILLNLNDTGEIQ